MTIKENRLTSYYREQLVILRMDTYEEPREIAQAWVDALDKKDVLDLVEEFDIVGIVDLTGLGHHARARILSPKRHQ